MRDWEETTLGELIDIKHGYAFKGEFFTEVPNGNALLTPGNFHIGGGFKADKFKYYIGEIPEDYVLSPGDVIVTMTDLSKDGDTLGYSARIPESTNRFLHNQRLGLVSTISQKADINFIYWLLRTSHYQKTIVNSCSGSTVKHTSPSKIKDYEFILPPITEQVAIDEVLSSFEGKIENLRRQNETLERIAQTLFKHWFVDFEFPNEDGKPYKSSGGAVERSELGEIPAGWRVVRAEEIADRIAMGPFGSRITTDNFVDSGVPVIRGSNLVNGFNEREFVYLTEEKADELKSSNAFPEDIVFTHRGTLGQVGFIPAHSQYPRYVVSQSQMLLGVNKKLASSRFVYRFFCSQVGMNAILANTNTTGVPSIGRPTTTLKSIQITLPEEKVMHHFDSLIKAIDFKKEANDKQIRTLTKTRDILIPKLISGQLRIIE